MFNSHMPYGPISFVACLHLAAATPNHVIQEGGGNVAASKNYLTKPLVLLEGGFVAVPDGPGLGFELDEAKLIGTDTRQDRCRAVSHGPRSGATH